MMRNPDAKHVDFRDLIGVMGSMLPSNIDMMIERNGYFLVGEWKREGEAISMGQKILLRQLATQPKFVVLVIQGNTDDGVMLVEKIWRMQGNGDLKLIGDSVDRLKEILKNWKEKVEQL
jgi:hypothetical protein